MMAQSRGPAYTATDRPAVATHAREQWADRGDDAIAVDDAWRAADPVPAGVHNARFVRKHHPTGCRLIAYRKHPGRQSVVVLVTVLAPGHDDPGEEFVDRAGIAPGGDDAGE